MQPLLSCGWAYAEKERDSLACLLPRLLMGFLDMKGLLGAATVIGTLMYGAGHVWAGRANFYLHESELCRSPPDASFIDMLKQNCCLAGLHFPPLLLLKSFRTMLPTFIKYGGYILSWWTCGPGVAPKR